MQHLITGSFAGEVHWKRYLILIRLSQCLFQLSFSFSLPFVPFFMQTLGIHGKELSFWVALMMAGLSLTLGMLYLVIMRPLTNFAVDCIEPSLQVWLCRKVDQTARNIALAWAQPLRSAGWFPAPLGAGLVVQSFGLRALFAAGGMIFLVIMIIIAWVCRREYRHNKHHRHEEPEPTV